MPKWNVKLKNGRWRVYSTVVDDYITKEMDFDELLEYRRELAIQNADKETYSLLTDKPLINITTEEEIQDYTDMMNEVNASDGNC